MTTNSYTRSRILVFDSGLGGLSIVRELTNSSLDVDIFYVADTAFFPYGDKADVLLIARIPDVITKAVKVSAANLVIIACNTASTLTLDIVRERLNIPVIGVVPAIKPAAALTKSGTIGLLATPNTVARPYTDKLIADFAAGQKVVRHGAVGLATAAETALSGGALDMAVVQSSIDGLFGQAGGNAIDVVVLACTHYPHLKAELAACAPRLVTWVDSGAAIAARARSLLCLTDAVAPALVTAFTTGGGDRPTALGLSNWGFSEVASLQVPLPSNPAPR
jgi:glutamate racemase